MGQAPREALLQSKLDGLSDSSGYSMALDFSFFFSFIVFYFNEIYPELSYILDG